MKNNVTKPDWLSKLEQESWQAELIVSGVAIFGSLQLPGLLERIGEFAMTFFSPDNFILLYLFFNYAFIAAYVIIVGFVLHFVLRALWIGLIGLNSVFPEGINMEGGYYPRHFMEKIVRDFPNENGMINGLDNFCSVIFAFCSYAVLVFVAINLDVVAVYVIGKLLKNLLPENLFVLLTYLVAFVFIGLLVSVSLFSMKQLKETKYARRFQYPFFRLLTKTTFHIFYRAINRISFTFLSNLNMRQYFSWTLGFLFLVIFIAIANLVNSNLVFAVKSELLFDRYARTDIIYPENYDNLRQPGNGRLLSASIESDRVTGSTLRVFVPVFKNEEEVMKSRCGDWTAPDSLAGQAAREWERRRYFGCLDKYHRFYINDSLYSVELQRYKDEQQGKSGVLTYLPTSNFREGQNLLKIEKVENEMDSVYRTMNIPFWFYPASSTGGKINKPADAPPND